KKRDYASARQQLDAAVKVRTDLTAVQPENSDYQRLLANTYMNIGVSEFNAADAAATDDQYAARLKDARKQFETAQQIRAAALARDPKNVKLRRDLGKGHFNLGNFEWNFAQLPEPAAKHYQSAADLFEQLAAEQSGDIENRRLVATCY